MEQTFWILITSSGMKLFLPYLRELILCAIIFKIDSLFILTSYLARRAFRMQEWRELDPATAPSALLVSPTLMRKRDELDGLKDAMLTVINNGYPGPLTVIAAIDDAKASGPLFTELEEFVRTVPTPPNVKCMVVGAKIRAGKAMAVHFAVDHLKEMIAHGEMDKFPEIFFNMDADSALSPRALERMISKLTTPSPIFHKKPMIVASNVTIAPSHYWHGWRELFTARGLLVLCAAREFMTSITLSKFNTKLFPVIVASGALYCTRAELLLNGPKWAGFMQSLTIRDWLRWWVGHAPPRLADYKGEERPEAMTGPGDDTWMTWLSCSVSWKDGKISYDMPRTPAHAFYRFIRNYFIRPLQFDPGAKVLTGSPESAKALFKQRMRWNASRLDNLGRWHRSFLYNWHIGFYAFSSAALQKLGITILITLSIFTVPIMMWEGKFVTAALLAYMAHTTLSLYGTLLAIFVVGDFRKNWRTLLAVPLAPIYHLIFNITTTVLGFYKDIFFTGNVTQFAPEETFIRSRLFRIAIGYRLKRAFLLTVRSALYNDVPFGAFWFGWHETQWTSSGFVGWTSNKKPKAILKVEDPRTDPRLADARSWLGRLSDKLDWLAWVKRPANPLVGSDASPPTTATPPASGVRLSAPPAAPDSAPETKAASGVVSVGEKAEEKGSEAAVGQAVKRPSRAPPK